MADHQTVKALVLPLKAASSSEPHVVADFPGRWIPGVPYALDALGVTEDEARRLLAAVPTPLELVDVEASEALVEFRRPAGSHAPSGLAHVEADREADAKRTAEPVVNEQGDVLHPGHLPGVDVNRPAWVDAQVDRATRLSKGQSFDLGVEAARAEYVERIRGARKDDLLVEAEAMGVPSAGLKVDELREAVLARYEENLERPDVPGSTTLVEIAEVPEEDA